VTRGRPRAEYCKHGHGPWAPRSSNGTCIQCHREQNRGGRTYRALARRLRHQAENEVLATHRREVERRYLELIAGVLGGDREADMLRLARE
jgi:hypothetical protein